MAATLYILSVHKSLRYSSSKLSLELVSQLYEYKLQIIN
jgi:hypothetical protein